MNRELKFRAWIKDEGEMRYPSSDRYIKFDGDCYYIVRNSANSRKQIFQRENPDNIELMQYTGIKDKNGKEIYEGDIVRSDGSMNFSTPTAQSKSVREIYKMPSGFTGVRINNQFDKSNFSSASNWSNYTLFNIRGSLEITGNIYENPELLENNNAD